MPNRTPRPRLVLASSLLLVLLLMVTSVRAEPESEVHVSRSHGFRLTRPGPDWTFREAADAASGSLTLVLRPAAAATTGRIQVTVRVAAAPADRTAAAARDEALTGAIGRKDCTNAERTALRIGGADAPGLAVDLTMAGDVYHVRQGYVVANGRIYTIGAHAPKAEFDRWAERFERAWVSFALVPVVEAGEERLRHLAARCGREVGGVRAWSAAAARASAERRLILVVVHSLSGFRITDPARTGPLMDTDVIALLQERFVVFHWAKGVDAPFVKHEVYGMGPSTFGTSLLVATPEGEIVGDTFAMAGGWVRRFLVDVLATRPEATGPPRPELEGIAKAVWHLRRGEDGKAAALVPKPRSPVEHRLLAAVHRRARRGEAALASLKRARDLGDEKAAPEILADRAAVLLRMGRLDEAESELRIFLELHGESPRLPEVLYRLGACRLRQGDREEAGTLWRRLTGTHPDSRWAWKAAAALTSTGFALGYTMRLSWRDEDLDVFLRSPAYEPLPVRRAGEAERRAKTRLLRLQREDGSWLHPVQALRAEGQGSRAFTETITALCAQSLLPDRSSPPVRRAIDRAIDHLLETLPAAAAEKPHFMDYAVWRAAWTLWFLVEAVEAGAVDRSRVDPALKALVAELREKQKPGGGWSYYVTTDLRAAGQPSSQSISFVTGAVLLALTRAREAEVDVPASMTDGAIRCLLRMRGADGTFAYMMAPDPPEARGGAAPAGAAGRGPVCSLALLRAGRGSVEEVRRALDLFLEHRAGFGRERGKSLMHTGLAAQGSHYLLFDYATAAMTVRALPEKERERYVEPLLELVLDTRTTDGGYVDNPIMGEPCGTGLALMAFRALRP